MPLLRRPTALAALSLAATVLVLVLAVRLTMPSSEAPVVAPVANATDEPASIVDTGLPLRPMPLPTSYVVEEGDSLLAIAARLDSPVEALRLANNLTDLNILQVGQLMLVPAPGSSVQPVDPSMTVAESARQYELDPAVLAAYNSVPVELVDRSLGRSSVVIPPGLIATEAPTEAKLAGETRYTVEFGADRLVEPGTYRVQPGDTLEQVAWRLGIDVDTLVNNNQLSDADRIRMGDELKVLPVSGLLYRVETGDTLSGLAQRFQVDLGPIIDFNYLDDLDVIQVGREMILPGASPLPPPPPLFPTTYQVGPGDTLLDIARRFGISAEDIVTANGISRPDLIGIGTSLRIAPGPAGSATARPQQQTPSVTRNLPVPLPDPAAVTRPSTPGAGGRIVTTAMQFNGYRYVWGGATPAGFDSSGYIYYVMREAGFPVSRGYWGQMNAGPRVGRDELQPGDLVFFQNTYMSGLSHGGIYIGNGNFIHASTPETGVNIANINSAYWASRWFGATRPW